MNTLEQRIRLEVACVVVNTSNWPAAVVPHLLGRDLAGPIDKITAALLPLILEAQAEAWESGAEATIQYVTDEKAGYLPPENPYRNTP